MTNHTTDLRDKFLALIERMEKAEDENARLRAEIKNWREAKTLFDQTADDNEHLRHQVAALDHELDVLKTELAEKSWRVIGPKFENMPLLGQKVMICTDGKVLDVPAKAAQLSPCFTVWERYAGTFTLIKPGDAWMPWPTEPKLLEPNND